MELVAAEETGVSVPTADRQSASDAIVTCDAHENRPFMMHDFQPKAPGCRGMRGEEPNALAPAMREASTNGKPTVVDVQTSLDKTLRKAPSPLVGER